MARFVQNLIPPEETVTSSGKSDVITDAFRNSNTVAFRKGNGLELKAESNRVDVPKTASTSPRKSCQKLGENKNSRVSIAILGFPWSRNAAVFHPGKLFQHLFSHKRVPLIAGGGKKRPLLLVTAWTHIVPNVHLCQNKKKHENWHCWLQPLLLRRRVRKSLKLEHAVTDEDVAELFGEARNRDKKTRIAEFEPVCAGAPWHRSRISLLNKLEKLSPVHNELTFSSKA